MGEQTKTATTTATTFLLDVPWEERSVASARGATWDKKRGAWTYTGTDLPEALTPYRAPKYSWLDYQMHTGRAASAPATSTGSITLRPDQRADVDTLLAAFNAGAPEVLVASKTGTGKTFVALVTAISLPRSGKILIVCPKSVIPAWRASIEDVGAQGKRFAIINYESLKRLIKEPKTPAKPKAKTKRGRRNATRRANVAHVSKGTGKEKWDVIIFDEAHYLANPDSQRSRAAHTITETSADPRIIRVSATIGRDPSKLMSLARAFAWSRGMSIPQSLVTPEKWGQWCQGHGMSVELKTWGKSSYLSWNKNDRDLALINTMMFSSSPPWAVRSDPGWEKTRRYAVPLELTRAEKSAYHEAWSQFASVVKALDSGAPPEGQARNKASMEGRAALIRYRQKSGILKAPYVAAYINDLLEDGVTQVAVSCEFMGTLDAITEHLSTMPALFTGRNTDTREAERVAFQRGDKRVILFTPAEGFSLHQGERGGNDNPRVHIVAEPSYSPVKALQKEGRTNRDGRTAPVLYMTATGTIDEKVSKSILDGFDSMSQMFDLESSDISVLSAWATRV